MSELGYVAPEEYFIQPPANWMFELGGEDYRRLCILLFRFGYFADMAFENGEDVTRCYYESQKTMCLHFGMSENSRTKVGQFLSRMEKGKYISIVKERMRVEEEWQVRHYIVVNEARLLSRYGISI